MGTQACTVIMVLGESPTQSCPTHPSYSRLKWQPQRRPRPVGAPQPHPLYLMVPWCVCVWVRRMDENESQKGYPQPSAATWTQSRMTQVRGADWGPRGPKSPARDWALPFVPSAASRAAFLSLPPSLGLALVGTQDAGRLSLTLAPIWLPHWPAWMCTISLMLTSRGYRRKGRRTAGCGGSTASAAPSYKRLPRPRWLM